MDEIIISAKRDHSFDERKRERELNKLKLLELQEVMEQYGFLEVYELKLTRAILIYTIILYEKMLLGGKQTEIKVYLDNDFKSYFVETKSNLIMVIKSRIIDDLQMYYINNDIFKQEKIDKDCKKYIGYTLKELRTGRIIKDINTIINGFIKPDDMTYHMINENNDIPYGFSGCNCGDNTSLVKDIDSCCKAMVFIESLHFFLEVKRLLHLFDNNHDIIRNICLIYFDRTLKNISAIRCKLQ